MYSVGDKMERYILTINGEYLRTFDIYGFEKINLFVTRKRAEEEIKKYFSNSKNVTVKRIRVV